MDHKHASDMTDAEYKAARANRAWRGGAPPSAPGTADPETRVITHGAAASPPAPQVPPAKPAATMNDAEFREALRTRSWRQQP